VSERSTSLLWALLAGTILAFGLLVAGIAALAWHLAGDAVTFAGALSACAFSLAQTRTIPLLLLLPLVLGMLSAAGLARALLNYRRERRLLRLLTLERVAEGELGELARATGVELYRVPASRPAAFCFGLRRPRVVFTSGLLDRLSADEQAAAFWHEAQHVRVREPLRCLFARLTANTFFWIPVLRDLLDRYTLVRELDADRLATTRTSTNALAGALHEVVAVPAFAGAVGFADLAAARVDRLLDPNTPLPSLFKRSRVALSVGAVALLGLAFTYPANVPVAKKVQSQTMMMKMPVATSAGVRWTLVPCG